MVAEDGSTRLDPQFIAKRVDNINRIRHGGATLLMYVI